MSGTFKDKLTNIVGIIVALGTIVASVLNEVPAEAQWYVWIGALVVAIISWATGKDSQLRAKK